MGTSRKLKNNLATMVCLERLPQGNIVGLVAHETEIGDTIAAIPPI